MIIGITGKSGSGKTTMANIIRDEFGFEVIHGDEVAHEVLDFYAYKFFLDSHNIPLNGNKVDRKYLGQYLFNSESLMKDYNNYIYVLIENALDNLLKDKTKNYIIDWNFLPITSYFKECDIKILMKCDTEIRRERVKNRDNITDEYFTSRESKGLEYNDEDYDILMVNDNLLERKEEIKKVLGEYLCK